MAKFLTDMNGGLQTNLDAALAPRNSLRRAVDAKYVAEKIGPTVAQGRAFAGGDAPTAGQGTHSAVPIRHLAAIAWDEGSTVDGITPELAQIVYAGDVTVFGSTFDAFKFLPFETNSSSPALKTASVSVSIPDSIGSDPLQVVQFENDWYFFTGATNGNLVVKRLDTGQTAFRHGLPVQTIKPRPSQVNASSDTLPDGMLLGLHFFWFTWYNSTLDVESSTNIDAVGVWATNSSTPGTDPVTGGATNILGNHLLYVRKDLFDAAVPTGANRVRVYAGRLSLTLPELVDLLGSFGNQGEITEPLPNTSHVFPFGNRYIQASISTIQSTETLGTDGNTYYNLVRGADGLLAGFRPDRADSVGNVVTRSDYDVYPIVSVVEAGGGTSTSLRDAPPNATTGATFEEALVVNDKDNPRNINYSFTSGHYFPFPFFISFETEDTDRVVRLQSLGEFLGVYMRYSTWRVNWLPRQGDDDFNRGRARTLVSPRKGIVSVNGLAEFSHPTFGAAHAMVSDDGIYFTNLRKFVKATSALDWEASVGSPELGFLVDNPDEERLEFFHPGAGSSVVDSITFLHYDRAHLTEEGLPAIMGPVRRDGVAAVAVGPRLDGKRQVVSTDERGSIFYEHEGSSDLSPNTSSDETQGVAMAMDCESQEINPLGPGSSIEVQRLLAHARGSGTYKVTARTQKIGVSRTHTLTQQDDVLSTKTGNTQAERVIFELKGSGGDARINAVGFYWRSDHPEVER